MKEEGRIGLWRLVWFYSVNQKSQKKLHSLRVQTVPIYKFTQFLGFFKPNMHESPSRHTPHSTVTLLPGPSRQLLQSNTGVIMLHLTYLLTACLPTFSPTAAPAEPCPLVTYLCKSKSVGEMALPIFALYYYVCAHHTVIMWLDSTLNLDPNGKKDM